MLSHKQRILSVFFPFFPLSKGLAIDVCCQSYIKPSSEIKRGEAQSQTQMQITKTQNKDTDVKNLAKDAINGANKITDKVTNLVEDTKTFVDDVKNSLSKT